MIATAAVLPASIPSPSQGSWDLGPFELRAYALCIMAGIVLAVWVGNKRWLARGGQPGVVVDMAVWAVPFGIVGGRLYHVVTDNQLYFREGRDPWRALQIWEGGLGVWGAIAFGALGVWIACRRRGVPFAAMADALAPGILLAQAVGRVGNWFNQELFGDPSTLPWALEIDAEHRPAGLEDVETFHPTFLYEALWVAFLALVLVVVDRRFRLGHGRVFALYVAGYTVGRGFWEYLRVDPANEIAGVRVNLWVSGVLFLAAVGYFVWSLRRWPGREDPETLRGFYVEADPFAGSSKNDDGVKDDEPLTLPDDEPEAAANPASEASGNEKPDDEKAQVSGADQPAADESGADEPSAEGSRTEGPGPEAAGEDAASKEEPAGHTAAEAPGEPQSADRT